MRRPSSVRIGMFCRLGSVVESRPVAAIVWLNVVWIRPSDWTVFSRPSIVCRSRLTSRWRSRRHQERVLGLLVQALQRVGVGRVAGLGALGLRHAELLEEHDLQLLGRAEVDLLADHPEGLRRRVADLGSEVALERLEVVEVDGDAGLLHRGQQVDQRQLDVGEQPGATGLLDLAVEGVGEVEYGARVQHRRLGDASSVASSSNSSSS